MKPLPDERFSETVIVGFGLGAVGQEVGSTRTYGDSATSALDLQWTSEHSAKEQRAISDIGGLAVSATDRERDGLARQRRHDRCGRKDRPFDGHDITRGDVRRTL